MRSYNVLLKYFFTKKLQQYFLKIIIGPIFKQILQFLEIWIGERFVVFDTFIWFIFKDTYHLCLSDSFFLVIYKLKKFYDFFRMYDAFKLFVFPAFHAVVASFITNLRIEIFFAQIVELKLSPTHVFFFTIFDHLSKLSITEHFTGC